MSDLAKELAELRSFVAYLKADRDEQKRKEAAEKWTKWVSLSIVFLAVGAALANQQYGGFSGRGQRELNHAAIEQGKATNKWSYYQSVSIKLHLYQFEKERAAQRAKQKVSDAAEALSPAAEPAKADLKPAALEGGGKPKKKKKKDKGGGAAYIEKKIAKYENQKMTIMAAARAHEKKRDEHRENAVTAQKHTSELTLALAVLQVAIAVGSIAALAKKKPLWFVSMVIGAYGVFQTFNGIFLWMV